MMDSAEVQQKPEVVDSDPIAPTEVPMNPPKLVASLEEELQIHKKELHMHKENAEETLLAFLQFADGVRKITRHMQSVPSQSDTEEAKEETDAATQGDNPASNVPLLEIESMVSSTCLQGTVFGTDLLRLWDAAQHMRDFARLVSEESSISANDILQAQAVARNALRRAKRAESVAHNLHTRNRELKRQVLKLSGERRLLVQEVKSLRQQAATARKLDMQRLLHQHVAGALLVHEEHLKATIMAQQKQQQQLKKQERRRKHAEEEEKKEDPDDEDSVEVVGLEECEGMEEKETVNDDAASASKPEPLEETTQDGKLDCTADSQKSAVEEDTVEEASASSNVMVEASPPPTSQAELIAIAKARVDANKEQQEGGAFRIFKRAMGTGSPRRTPPRSPQRRESTPVDAVPAAVKPEEVEAVQLPSLETETATKEEDTKDKGAPSDPAKDEESCAGATECSNKENDSSEPEKADEGPSSAPKTDQQCKDDNDDISDSTKQGPTKPPAPTQAVSSSYSPVKLLPSVGRVSPPPSLQHHKEPDKPDSSRSVETHDSWFDGPVEPRENVGSKVFNFLFYPEKMSVQRQQEQLRQQQLRKLQQENQAQQPQQHKKEQPKQSSQAAQPKSQAVPTPVRGSKQKPLLELNEPSSDDKDAASVDDTAPTITATTPGSTYAGSRARSMSGDRQNASDNKHLQQQTTHLNKGHIPNCVSFSDDTLSVQSNLPSPKFQPSSKRALAISASSSDDDGDSDSDGSIKGKQERQVELYQDLKVFRSLAIPTDDEIDDYHQCQNDGTTLLPVQKKSKHVIQ
ncbi:expressed unknown protein [Seminavis robusta]|uniref:Uncharacterized protein n=1 Tax=Seminavis robusta TaxID=568900 RepID=A0A9N8DDJ4_9STRA|nr:expressed unknown protein [Seminavis robusta]|eukprot:Sro89_g046840.1 n/a (803) ;mRNA; r:35326-37734